MFLLLSTVCFFFTLVHAVSTNIPCKPGNCNKASLVPTGNDRILGNRVDPVFKGFVNVHSNKQGSTFSADMKVLSGEAWPRISEGVAIPDSNTPGYPVSLTDYFANDALHINYGGKWLPRTRGPPPLGLPPKGLLYNGVQIYLNDPDNYTPGTKLPLWPFTVEIKIWNRYDGLTHDLEPVCKYNDTDGVYEVVSGPVPRGDNITLLGYIIMNQSNKKKASMNIDTVKLFKHLITRCKLSQNLDILETTVIAQGFGAGTDAKFYADIESMGRAPELPENNSESATQPAGGTAAADKENNDGGPARPTGGNGDGQAKWEIVGSVIGAIATLIAAILTVYLSQGKCRRRRKQNNNIGITNQMDRRFGNNTPPPHVYVAPHQMEHMEYLENQRSQRRSDYMEYI